MKLKYASSGETGGIYIVGPVCTLLVYFECFNRVGPNFEAKLDRSYIPVKIDWYGNEEFPREYDEEDENYDEDYQEWSSNRLVILPDAPAQFNPPPIPTSGRITLRGQKVQVIVKLASICSLSRESHLPRRGLARGRNEK